MQTLIGRHGLLAIFVLLMAAFAGKGLLIAPPHPPSVAAAGTFNTPRAVARLARILGDERPHPVDSAGNDAVRQRLMAELQAIGVTPQVREATDCRGSPKTRVVSCSHTRNIVASLGPPTGKRLLLNAHYDSTPAGPGAADDGIGVATLIEVGALLRGEALARPVTLLFNEGEEYGLNGASTFVERDPLAREVDSLINVESRGVNGPALMFETSVPNGPALSDYARAARRPYANSISTDMATLIPNSTDVVVFKDRQWKTLSYSIIGNETRYHSPGDTVAALDRASVHHLGSELLAATRVMAGPAKGRSEAQRLVFTDIAGRGFIRLPLIVAASLLAALLAATLLMAWRAKAIGRPLLVVAGAFVAAVVGGWLVSEAAALVRPGDYFRAFPLVAYLALYATVLALAASLLSRWSGPIERLRLACWTLILIVGSLFSLVLPGASIFFLIAPAIALAGIALKPRAPRVGATLRWAAALFQLLMFAELLALIELLLVDGPLAAAAPLAALAALPFLVEVAAPRSGHALRHVATCAAALWIAALMMPRASSERPGAFAIDYLRDDIHGRSQWIVATRQAPLPANWASLGAWRRTDLPFYRSPRWTSDAPALALPKPSVAVRSIKANGAGRIVRLALDRGGNDSISLRIAKGVTVAAMGLAGSPRLIPSDAAPGPSVLRCTGRSCDGLEVELRFADAAPVKAALIGTRFALPAEGARLVRERPSPSHPQYAPDSSLHIVGVRF